MKRRPWKKWTKREEATLKRLYPTTLTSELVRLLGRSPSSLSQHVAKMGLRKDPAFHASIASVRAKLRTGAAAGKRFTPGQRPWNAGLKGLQLSPATQFKKGNRPHTWVPVGSVSEHDGYRHRKIADTGDMATDWKSLHALRWERYRGPVPPGHAIVFKDRDRTNIKIANLECVSRAELMRRNSVHTNYPPEIVRLIQLRGAVQRQINRWERHEQD